MILKKHTHVKKVGHTSSICLAFIDELETQLHIYQKKLLK